MVRDNKGGWVLRVLVKTTHVTNGSHFLQLKYFWHSLVMLSALISLPNLCVSGLQPRLLYITNQVNHVSFSRG